MNRYLCIWLPNLPIPNGPPNGVALEPSGLTAMAQLIQQQICPAVAIESLDKQPWAGQPAHRCESLLCDISGVAHLFAGEAGMLSAIGERLAARKISGQMAIADSVGAAWAIAHYPQQCFPPDREHDTANVSPTRVVIADPIQALIVASGKTGPALEPLPVESLRIGVETAGTLSRLGIHSVGQLFQLPRSGLAPRLGKPLIRRLEQALGEVAEPLTIYQPPVEPVASHRLEYPTSDQNILADRVDRLTKEITASLEKGQCGALRMTCRLDLTDHPPLTLEVGLFAPTIDAEHLYGLLIHRIETIRLPAPVQQLTLSVPLTGPLRNLQGTLFSQDSQASNGFASPAMMKNISRLVDSLSGRLGCDSVVGVKIKDNPLPEKAFTVSPLAGTGSAGTDSLRKGPARNGLARKGLARKGLARKGPARKGLAGTGQASVRPGQSGHSPAGSLATTRFPAPDQAMRRPLSLLAKPISIAVANHHSPFRLTVASADVPERIRIGGTIHRIVRAWGSERIETGWWNGPSIRRDYYRIETDSAQWWWIFRDFAATEDGYRWMLHGKFS